MPFGLLFVPFLVGVAVTLLIVAGIGQDIGGGWVTAAVVVGAALSAVVLTRTLRGGGPSSLMRPVPAGAPLPTRLADPVAPLLQAARPEPAKDADPLANIHAVEAQARRLSRDCLNCGTSVSPEAAACPSCGHQFMVNCKGCKTQVRVDWSHCPECGRRLS